MMYLSYRAPTRSETAAPTPAQSETCKRNFAKTRALRLWSSARHPEDSPALLKTSSVVFQNHMRCLSTPHPLSFNQDNYLLDVDLTVTVGPYFTQGNVLSPAVVRRFLQSTVGLAHGDNKFPQAKWGPTITLRPTSKVQLSWLKDNGCGVERQRMWF